MTWLSPCPAENLIKSGTNFVVEGIPCHAPCIATTVAFPTAYNTATTKWLFPSASQCSKITNLLAGGNGGIFHIRYSKVRK